LHEEEAQILRRIKNAERINPYETVRVTMEEEKMRDFIHFALEIRRGELWGASKTAYAAAE
jgi:hypothetical protein